MKAMILAAGLGTRMRPLTLETPKPLLSVADKPLIVWHLESLKRAGIDDIVINTAWLSEKLVSALGDGSAWSVRITWSHETEGLETAGGIIKALPYLGADPFLLVNGDVWTRFDFCHLTQVALHNRLAHLVLVDNPEQHPEGDFYLDGKGFIHDFQQDQDNLTYSGLSVISPQLFAGLAAGKRPLAPILRSAMAKQLITGQKTESSWVDVGTPERLQQLDQQIVNGTI